MAYSSWQRATKCCRTSTTPSVQVVRVVLTTLLSFRGPRFVLQCKGADTLVSWPRVALLLASHNVKGLQFFAYCGLRTLLVGNRLSRLLLCLGEEPALGEATKMTQLRFPPAAMHPNYRIADQGNASIWRWLIFTFGWADSPYWSLYYNSSLADCTNVWNIEIILTHSCRCIVLIT